MRLAAISYLLFGMLFQSTANAEDYRDPEEVPAPVQRIFVPGGYDDNDNIEVILTGVFPDSCYRVGKTGYKVDHQKRRIEVWATALRYPTEDCAEILTPFLHSIKIGVLDRGFYGVHYTGEGVVSQQLAVSRRTTEDPDEYFYAPVDYADIMTDSQSGEQTLLLIGTYPQMLRGCAKFSEVRLREDSARVLIVQPILEVVEGEECANRPLKYARSFPLNSNFAGEGLLHVRVLNGQSYNRLIHIE